VDKRLRFKWFWTRGVRESITRTTTSNLTQFDACGQLFIVRPLARLGIAHQSWRSGMKGESTSGLPESQLRWSGSKDL
jgi:hypothetical protein